jgi:hypothetical protein
MVTGSGWGVSTDGGDGTFLKQGSTAGLSYSGGYTAEWIAEDYALADGTLAPLANFAPVTFSDLRTSLTPWYLTPSDGLGLVQNSVTLATPSSVTGNSFSISYAG